MRNLRKLTAAVLAVALALSSMTAVFAADAATIANADKAATLKDLGLYAGTDASDVAAGLDGALTTQDSLIFLARLFGYFETANKLTADQVSEDLAKFDDAASISDYAKRVVAYSASNGIVSGSTKDGKFFVGAKDTVTAARFATFMLMQMGIKVGDYKTSVTKLAETKGSKVDATITGDLTRDTAVGIMYAALTAEKASGKTVIADIIGDNADLKAKAEKLGLITAPVTTDVAVESVKALNTKQIEVVFNQEMDKDSVESENFYEIQDMGSHKVELGDSSASLGADNKTVTITLNKNVADKLTNSTVAKVIVKKDIKADSGTKLAKDATFDKVEVQDGIIPTVRKVEATGERNIKITFSEPVYDKGNDNSIAVTNFKVVSGTYTYFVQKATLDNNVINLEIGTKLIEGPITVTVNEAGLNNINAIVDYAGYAVFKGSTTFNYVKDTSVAVVTVKSAKANKVVLNFSKPVKGSHIRLYHTIKNVEFNKAEATVTDYSDEFTFTFDTLLPSGRLNLYLVNSEATNEKLVDSYGIKVPDQSLTCDVEVVPPVVTVKSAKANMIVLNFSKPVKGSYIKLCYSDKSNESYKAEATKTDFTDEITFVFNSSLPIGKLNLFLVNSTTEGEKLIDSDGIYVPDQSLTCDVEEVPAPQVETDTTAPFVIQCVVNKNESIRIIFNEELDTGVATNPDCYVVKKLSDNNEIPLSAEIDDSRKSVELIFSENLDDYTQYQLLIKRYKDIYGNINTSDYEYVFTTLEYEYPEVIDDPENDQRCFSIAEKGKIFIIYSEAMNEAQMLDKGNYQVSIDEGETYMDLGDNDTITRVNDRTVQIYFKEFEGTDINPSVKIASIMDLAGNKLYDSDEPYTVQNIEPENVYIEEAQLIAKNRIKVVFNKKMGSFTESDIELISTTPGAISVIDSESITTNSYGKTEVVLILDKDLATDATDEAGTWVGITTIADPSSESEWGSKLRSQFGTLLYDKTAPEIILWNHDEDVSTEDIAKVVASGNIADPQFYGNDYTVPQNTTGTITIYFSENILESSLNEGIFEVAGFTITDITAPYGTETVILTVKANADNTYVKTTVTQISEIYDTADNAFVPGSTWAVTLEDKPLTS